MTNRMGIQIKGGSEEENLNIQRPTSTLINSQYLKDILNVNVEKNVLNDITEIFKFQK